MVPIAESSGGYSGSALRYGLIGIRPIEIHEAIKKFGLKFERVTRTFESLKPSESFEDLVRFENEATFYTMKIPEWFDADKLIEVYTQRSIENYEKDTELKKKVDMARKATQKGKPFLTFIRFNIDRYESRRDSYLEIEADRFLRSNLPLSFYSTLFIRGNFLKN